MVKSNLELELVEAFLDKKKIKDMSNEEQATIFDTIGWWMTNLGIMNTISPIEMKLIADFIVENYSMLTIEEIKKAINLSITKRLNCDTELYNRSFSNMYVGRILEAYIQFRNDELREFYYRVEKQVQSIEPPKATAVDKKKIMVELLTTLYSDYVKDNTNIGYCYSVYDFLKKTNRLHLTKEIVEASVEYAKITSQKVIKDIYSNSMGELLQQYKNLDKEALKDKYARNYMVSVYFASCDFGKLIQSITEKEFE